MGGAGVIGLNKNGVRGGSPSRRLERGPVDVIDQPAFVAQWTEHLPSKHIVHKLRFFIVSQGHFLTNFRAILARRDGI